MAKILSIDLSAPDAEKTGHPTSFVLKIALQERLQAKIHYGKNLLQLTYQDGADFCSSGRGNLARRGS